MDVQYADDFVGGYRIAPTCHCDGCESEGRFEDPNCLYVSPMAYAVARGGSQDVAECFDAFVREERITRPTAESWPLFLRDDFYTDEIPADHLNTLTAALES